MELAAVLDVLGIPESLDLLAPHWAESVATLPAAPPFLDPAAVTEHRAFGLLPAELDAPLVALAAEIAANPALKLLAWHLDRLLFDHLDYPGTQFGRWPDLPALGERNGLFYLLLAFDAIPRMLAVHRQLGVPESISRQGHSYFGEAGRLHRYRQGVWGAERRTIYWLRNATTGVLYRVGRFEYMLRPFAPLVHVYREVPSGRLIALAADGLRFEAGGLCAYADGEPAWISRLVVDERGATGTPIDPRGHALPTEVHLPADRWQPALLPGETIYEIHIPDGSPMTLEACRESMADAHAFFRRTFPDQPAKAWSCISWILNPEIREWYRPDSNLARNQEQLYGYPYPSGGRDGLYFIFADSDLPVAAMRPDNSLRRAFRDHLAAGGRLRIGGGFLLLEDFARYGQGGYRPDWSLAGTEPVATPG